MKRFLAIFSILVMVTVCAFAQSEPQEAPEAQPTQVSIPQEYCHTYTLDQVTYDGQTWETQDPAVIIEVTPTTITVIQTDGQKYELVIDVVYDYNNDGSVYIITFSNDGEYMVYIPAKNELLVGDASTGSFFVGFKIAE